MSWITIYLLIKDKEGHILEKLLSWTPIRFYFLMLIYRWQASRLKRWDYNFTNLMLITTSKEKGKRKMVVTSAVTLRALDTFFSTTGYPSESSLLRNWLRNVWKQKKDCFCLRMWRDLNKTLGVHFIEVSVKRELAVVTEPVNRGPCRKETINLVSYQLPFELWSLPVTCLSLAPLLARLSYRTLARPNFPLFFPF